MKTPVFVNFLKSLLLLIGLCSSGWAAGQQVKFGNSYVNLSKKNIGGTVQPGDTLEIRTNIWFANNYNSRRIYRVRYVDDVPSNTQFIDDSIRLITNEGLTYKRWTLAAGDDPGTYNPSPGAGEFNIKINIGRDATAPANTSNDATGAGTVYTGNHTASGNNKDRPIAGGGVLITTSFKVRVTGNIGDIITLGAGSIHYGTSAGGGNQVQNATRYQILISNNDPICPNAIGKNFVAESGGSFDSGMVQNRTNPPTFLIPSYTYLNNMGPSDAIGDGFYGIVNNLSPTASTFNGAQKRPSCPTGSGPHACSNRMFGGHWDIIGDRTGATTADGNPPASPGSMGGYMLVVNADYATSEAYRQSISGLCPNTSYEFSLWVRNVCTNCGMDSTGTSTFTPGVYPNLSFAIDGLDRYSSGQIDTIGWQKKGFIFRTAEDQTDITISIRNNASGGGGNDWAIDDIALVTCNPSLDLIPSGDAQVCYGNQVDISSTVNSFFNNYTYFRFERSIDNGVSWTNAGGGTGSPATVPGGYEYNAVLVPSFLADSSHHLNQYRFVVASSADNLSNADCSFAASTTIIVMVNDCSWVLSTKDTSDRLTKAVIRTGKRAEIHRLVNPFSHQLSFDLVATANDAATITVLDNYGRVVRIFKNKVLKGYNHVILDKLGHLSKGTYFLRVEVNREIINKIVVKK